MVSMGYIMGDTAAPGLTEFLRCALLGNAIDQNLATALVRSLSEAPQPSCCMACTVGSRCQFDGLCDCLACSSSTRPLDVLNASATKSDPPAPVPSDLPCTLCDCTEGADSMLICDSCERGFHLHCLVPPAASHRPAAFFAPAATQTSTIRPARCTTARPPWSTAPRTSFQTRP
jgi:hypothetical protein